MNGYKFGLPSYPHLFLAGKSCFRMLFLDEITDLYFWNYFSNFGCHRTGRSSEAAVQHGGNNLFAGDDCAAQASNFDFEDRFERR